MKKLDKHGFTESEADVHKSIMDAYSKFLKLDVQHPSEQDEFALAIHIIQGILTTRIARRCFPEGWPDYGKNKKGC